MKVVVDTDQSERKPGDPVVIGFTPELAAQLDALRVEAGLDSILSVITSSLALLMWAAKESRQGNMIAAVNSTNQYQAITLPILDQLAKKAKKQTAFGLPVV
jgi:hypothetical protein